MKTRRAKTILSILLTFALVLGLMTTGYAAPEGEPAEETQSGEVVPEGTEETEYTEGTENTENTENIENTADTEMTGEADPGTNTADSDADSDANAGIRLLAAEPEELSEEVEEEDPEDADSEIQVFAATEDEQDLIVTQEAEGTIGADVSFPYHIYQITEAEETITNMSDITASEAGADLAYVICDADGNEISSGTTDAEGSFALTVGQSVQFTLDADTSWYVTQDTPEAYPLLSVESDGDYAGVVDSTNGVVYYGQIKPVITGVTVTSDLDGNEKTYDGEEVILTAEVSYDLDDATVSYQWYKDDEEISGATDSTCVLAGDVSDSGTYKCVVTVENDDRTASAEAEITITIHKAAQELSYGQSVVTKTGYEEDFTIALTETTVDGQITYASSDETVATVDSESGKVTIVGAGYATITATAAETDNYEEASASYVLIVNTAEFDWEIDVNSERVSWDEEKGEWVDDLTYTGEPLELEMTINLDADELENLAGITYQWYRYNSETQDFDEIKDATGEDYTLEGDDVNAGDYLYMCVAVVTYQNGTEDTVYGPIEVIIEKANQNIEFKAESLTAVAGDNVSNEIITEGSVIVGAVTYTSSDESIATVDATTGEVTIVGVGEATITATAAETDNYNEASSSYTITTTDEVSVAVTSDLEENNTKTYDGETVTLTAEVTYKAGNGTYTYQWEKENDSGEFTAIDGATGTTLTLEGNVADSGTYRCTVTVTYPNVADSTTANDSITITIEKADQSIVFEADSLTAVAGDAVTNEMTKDSVIDGTITYSSSDESVATVDENGNVMIVGVGTVTITATAAETDNYNAASSVYTLTTSDEVSLAVTSDMEEEDNTKTYDGETVTLIAEVTCKAGNGTYTYQWYTVDESGTETEISGETEATLTLAGNVAESGTYRCTVTVTYPNGAEPVTVSDTIEITIEKAAQRIVFEEGSPTAFIGDTFTNEISEDSVIDGTITYTGGDESVATVDQDGYVTIVGVGEVTITATASETDNYNAASASYTLTTTDEIIVTVASDMEGEDNTKTYDGETVTLKAEASSRVEGVTYTYQWYEESDDGSETEIEGATGDTLTLDGNAADSGIYRCTVTVIYPNGADSATVSDTIEITINKIKQDISYETEKLDKIIREEGTVTNRLTVTLLSPEEGAGITYESSDESVATVDENGEVTALSLGEVTITATAAETANYAEATASYTILVRDEYNVKYAVVIYGINQDVDADGNTLGLTFGPATGASHVGSYEAHLTEEQYENGEGICLHWMSWEEIIEQSEENPEAFEACLENGCTHSVDLWINGTLLDTGYTGKMDDGDGAGVLYRSIRSNYRKWNSSDDTTGGWPASQVRAVLNGKDEQLGDYAKYALDESDCLFSCFPSVLQNAIVPKAVKSDTVYDDTSGNNVTTYDKLWLFSGKELYEKNNLYPIIRDNEGVRYQRSEILEITTSNYGSLINYNENGTGDFWWLRTLAYGSFGYMNIYHLISNGSYSEYNASGTACGLAFGFCLK